MLVLVGMGVWLWPLVMVLLVGLRREGKWEGVELEGGGFAFEAHGCAGFVECRARKVR